jgi:hypothetical protein
VRQALVAKEIQKIIEVTHVTLAHRTSRSQAPETYRRSCHREHYHPSREDLVSGGSLPRMRNVRSARVHSHYTRMLADLPWGRASLSPFACVSEGSSAIRRLATERFLLNPCQVSPHATLAGPSGSTAGSRTSLSLSEGKSGISPSERPGDRALRRYSAKPHPFVAASGPPNAQGIECG